MLNNVIADISSSTTSVECEASEKYKYFRGIITDERPFQKFSSTIISVRFQLTVILEISILIQGLFPNIWQ